MGKVPRQYDHGLKEFIHALLYYHYLIGFMLIR